MTEEIHILTVTAVGPPEDFFDDRELEYDIEHPLSCKQESEPDGSYVVWTCDVAENERECGLAYSLRYSGTPITEPGTYKIRAWYKEYNIEYGYEYDSGVRIVTE